MSASVASAGAISKQHILIVDGAEAKEVGAHFVFITLPHPKDGIPVIYLYDSKNSNLFELQTAQPNKYGSFFINQRVSSSSEFYLASKVDARFLLLPALSRSLKFTPIDQIFTQVDRCDRFPTEVVNSCKFVDICDIKDLGDMILYRFNETKTIEWLKAKVAAAALICASHRIKHEQASSTVFASSFNISAQSALGASAGDREGSNANSDSSSTKLIEAPQETDLIKAAQLVGDYLEDSLFSKLVLSLGLDMSILNAKNAAAVAKRKADWELELELEKETLAFTSAQQKSSGANASSSNNSTSFGSTGAGNGGATSSNKTAKTHQNASNTSSSKPATKAAPPAGVKPITSFFQKK